MPATRANRKRECPGRSMTEQRRTDDDITYPLPPPYTPKRPKLLSLRFPACSLRSSSPCLPTPLSTRMRVTASVHKVGLIAPTLDPATRTYHPRVHRM